MLDVCTRETFSLIMLIKPGNITEKDVSLIFSAFQRLDAGNDGKLECRDILYYLIFASRCLCQTLGASGERGVQSTDGFQSIFIFSRRS
mmetsp:Transcript_1563/g.2537  ORF Transcript_1563/g.2537 Transcript_1563/m.2537 type:complete len:89 (+) Transcript_1563:502-768(+)